MWGIPGNASWLPELVTTRPCANCCSWQLLCNKEVVELKSHPRRPFWEPRDHPGLSSGLFFDCCVRLEALWWVMSGGKVMG